MQSKSVDVSQAQAQLAELLILVASGTEIILTDGDTPRARIVPVRTDAGPRVAGLHLGGIQASEDFDAPLPDEFWTGSRSLRKS